MPNNLVYVIMDSCRFDSVAEARTPNIDRIGRLERRFSYASWTLPSHYAYLMGLIPHQSPPGVFASEIYKQEFSRWIRRLNIDGLSFKSFVPCLSLPKVLKDYGFQTTARVSLPVLNPYTAINTHFDDYRLMQNHNDFKGMIQELRFSTSRPNFYFLNLGETHYPYMLDPKGLPHLSGVHGVYKRLDDDLGVKDSAAPFFDESQMRMFHRQQKRCVEYVDELMGVLLDKAPKDTYFIVTSDHGECFGESGYFGHGPIVHEKVFEVPFVEGVKP